MKKLKTNNRYVIARRTKSDAAISALSADKFEIASVAKLFPGRVKVKLLSFAFLIASMFFIAPVAFAWSEADQNLFEKANQDYRADRFEEAIKEYEELAEEYPELGMIAYNLGNAYFRTEDIGKAILFYERALKYEPRNRDIRRNLAHANALLEYKVDDKRNWYLKFGEKALNYFTEKEMLVLVLISFFFFLLSFVCALIFRKGAPWGVFRKGLLLITCLCLTLVIFKEIQTRVVRSAIVLEDEVAFYYGPSESDQVAFRLGKGLKVYVVDSRKNWRRVILTSGETGWAKSGQVVEV